MAEERKGEKSEGGQAAEPTMGRFLGKRLIRHAILVVVLSVLAYGALLFYGDFGEIRRTMEGLRLSVVLTAFALATGNFLVRAARWHYCLRYLGLWRVRLFESLIVFLSGFSMTITPAKAGEFLKSALLRHTHNIRLARTGPIVVAERVTDLAGLVLLLAVGSLAFPHGAVVAVVSGVMVLTIVLASTFRPFGELVLRIVARLPVLKRKADAFEHAYESLRVLSRPAPFAVGTMLAALAWGLQCGSLWVIASGFPALDVSLQASMFAYAMPLLAGTLAMLPGGLGLAEASMAGVLAQLGSGSGTQAAAAAVTIIVRLVTFWWAVVLGFAALGLWRIVFFRGTEES